MVNIKTKRLALKSFDKKYLTEQYVAWLNDPVVTQFSRQRHTEHTLEECKAYYRTFENSDNLFIAVIYQEGRRDVHIGNLTVTVDKLNSTADIAILIGDRRLWGKGIGFEAWRAISSYLLEELSIRKVTGGCYSTNLAMKKIMLNSGMAPDGIRKDHILVNGSPIDIEHYALFNELDK